MKVLRFEKPKKGVCGTEKVGKCCIVMKKMDHTKM